MVMAMSGDTGDTNEGQTMTWSALDQVTIPAIVEVFNDAFSRYEVPVHMTERQLERMIRARSIRLDRSFGLVEDGMLTAFALTGSRVIDGTMVAYNAGTGIRLARQRRGLGRELMRHTMDALGTAGYRRYLLEVLTSNRPAIGLYRNLGFKMLRTLHCYRASAAELAGAGSGTESPEGCAVRSDSVGAAPERHGGLLSYRPSWQNSVDAILSISDECLLFTAENDRGTTAFVVLEPSSGTLMQLGYAEGYETSAAMVVVRAAAGAEADQVKILNIDAEDRRTNGFLTRIGFQPIVSQFEMEYRW
jgi:GNAT superfamily N-acetyltransferase